jgi:hypothetical protein
MAQKIAASAVKVAACCTILRLPSLIPGFLEIFFFQNGRRGLSGRKQEFVFSSLAL